MSIRRTAIPVLLLVSGCAASTTRMPTFDEQVAVWLSEKPRSIALAVDREIPTLTVSITDYRSGGAAEGAGAGIGAVMSSPASWLFLPVVLPAAVIVGGIVGGGGKGQEPRTVHVKAQEVEGAIPLFETAARGLDMPALILNAVVDKIRASTRHAAVAQPPFTQGMAASGNDGQLMLQVRAVSLFGTIFKDSYVALVLQVGAHMQHPEFGTDHWGEFKYQGEPRLISEWSAGDAHLLRRELTAAFDSVAQQVAAKLASRATTEAFERANAAKSANGPPLAGYACCNLRYEDDWIGDGTHSTFRHFSAGTPIRTTEYGTYFSQVRIGGQSMFLGLDDRYDQESFLTWVRRIIVKDDPKPTISTWPETVQNAIRSNSVALGMTRDQVLVALGYPPSRLTPSLDASRWTYFYLRGETYQILWGEDGLVADIEGTLGTVAAVLASGSQLPTVLQLPQAQDGQDPLEPVTGSGTQMEDLEGMLQDKK